MQFHSFPTAQEFLSLIEPALQANEAANGLMYGLALRIREYPERFQSPPFLSAVTDSGHLQAAALMTPPHHLVVLSVDPNGQTAAFQVIAQKLIQHGWSVPGVLGPNTAALAFAQAWHGLTGKSHTLTYHERVYELRRVTPTPQPSGFMRAADDLDQELVARWIYEFHREALPDESITTEECQESARIRISDRTYYLWEDGSPVALAGWTRPTPHGCSIGPVYTPREYRRKGYAGALTSALSQLLLDQGKHFTSLFTDLSNPTSNSIYQKIGYRPVCDFDKYSFD